MKPTNPNSNLQDAIAYARVSSQKQVQQGNGLDSQLRRCRNYADQNGYRIIKEFKDEGISGATIDRPDIQALIQFVKDYPHPITVIIDEISRLARDAVIYYLLTRDIEKVGGKVVYVTQNFDRTPEGELITGIVVQISQYERTHNKERTIGRMKARTEAGSWPYGIFAGYRPSSVPGVREPDGAVAQVIKDALEGYAYGELVNFEEVARFINKHEVINYQGKKVKTNGFRAKKLLKSAWYHAGFVQLEKRGLGRRQGKHKAIISLEILERIENRLNGKPIGKYRKNLRHNFPLHGHILCADCGKPMTSGFNGKGDRYGYYCCRNHACKMDCHHVRYREVHEQFIDLLRGAKPSNDLLDFAVTILKDVWKDEWKNFQDERQAWGMEVRKLDDTIQACVRELVETGEAVVKSAIKRQIQEYTSRQEILKRKIADAQEAKDDFEAVLDTVMGILSSPDSAWLNADLPMKQTIQRLVFPKPLIYGQREQNFRNVERACVYRLFEEKPQEKELMARPKRFELLTF